MPFTLWSRGILLGRITDMIPKGVPAPAPTAGMIMGFFHATKEFSTHAGVLAEQAATPVDLESAKRFSEKLRTEAMTDAANLTPAQEAKIRDMVKGDPHFQQVAARQRAILELGLELKDDAGRVVPTGAIMVQPFPPSIPGMLAMPIDKLREKIKQEMTKAGLEVADLMLVAQPPAN